MQSYVRNWPKFAHGDTSHRTIWTAAIHAAHNWPQRPYSHVVCFACDSNPYTALAIVPRTLTNWSEELCKDTASSAAFTESLVRPHDVHVNDNVFRGEFRFAKPIGKGPDFVMWVLKEEHLCQLNVSPVLPIDVAYMQQSSSYRSPVLKKENTCSCQPVATVRQPFSPQFPTFQKVRSMKRVYSPMLKAEKA